MVKCANKLLVVIFCVFFAILGTGSYINFKSEAILTPNMPGYAEALAARNINTGILTPNMPGYAEAIAARQNSSCKKGIDVSYHNGDIDWQAVKNSGIEFAIIRTSYGWSNWEKQTDKKLRANISGAKAVGMPIGAYHYSYATNTHEALLEAEFFINRLRWTQWEYPVFMDFEDKCHMTLSNSQRTDIVLTFLQKLKENGYYCGLYTFLNFQKYHLDMNRLSGYELWIAHWHPTCGCTSSYGMWQHTSDGSVPGIRGRVDLDYCYKDYPSIIKNSHYNGF